MKTPDDASSLEPNQWEEDVNRVTKVFIVIISADYVQNKDKLRGLGCYNRKFCARSGALLGAPSRLLLGRKNAQNSNFFSSR